MNSLTIIEKNGKQLVDARELHNKLKSKRQFTNWIQGRIVKYEFEAGVDYFEENDLLNKNVKQNSLKTNEIQEKFFDISDVKDKKKLFKKPKENFTNMGGHNKTIILVTVTMAKELCLLERNEIGKAYRRYLIKVEKKAQEFIHKISDPQVINGIECISYDGWLITNGYSLLSSRVGERKRKYPDQFVKTDKGWYISRALANYFLKYKRIERKELPSLFCNKEPKINKVEEIVNRFNGIRSKAIGVEVKWTKK